jgi:hypothetical protein
LDGDLPAEIKPNSHELFFCVDLPCLWEWQFSRGLIRRLLHAGRADVIRQLILFLCIAMGIALDATATSCAPFKHRYFILCDGAGCRGAFSSIEISAFGACGRRPVVDSINREIGSFLGKIVMEARPANSSGLYMITLSSRFWGRANPNTPAGLSEVLDESLLRYDGRDKLDFASMPPSKIVELFNKHHGAHWLVHVTSDPTPQAVEAKRSDFEAEAIKEHAISIMLAIAYWLSFLVALLALIQSVHLYFLRLYDAGARKSSTALLTPVMIQLAILVVGIVPVFVAPSGLWPGTLLVPAAIVIMFAEGWAKFWRRRSS